MDGPLLLADESSGMVANVRIRIEVMGVGGFDDDKTLE